jgi:hypothetical protein
LRHPDQSKMAALQNAGGSSDHLCSQSEQQIAFRRGPVLPTGWSAGPEDGLIGDDAAARARWLDMIHRNEWECPNSGTRDWKEAESRMPARSIREWRGEKGICGQGTNGLFSPMLARAVTWLSASYLPPHAENLWAPLPGRSVRSLGELAESIGHFRTKTTFYNGLIWTLT